MAADKRGQKVTTQKYVKDVEVINEQNKELSTRWEQCSKKDNHQYYLTKADFLNNPWQHLDAKYKTIKELPGLLDGMAELTVCISVQHMTGDETTGSGFIQKIRRESSKMCPCHECDGKQKKEFAILTVTTVLHVFDKDCHTATELNVTWDVKKTKVKLFYDEDFEGADELPLLDSYRMLETDREPDIESDWCAIECVTHDMALAARLDKTLISYMDNQGAVYKAMTSLEHLDKKVIIVGHPHGGPKKFSIGEYIEDKTEVLKNVRNYQRWCRYNYNIVTCGGSSGSPLYIFGQPLCGFGYWFGHPHNHSKGDEKEMKAYSSIGVEHVQ